MRPRLFADAFVVTLLTAGAASAASFDCNRARTSTEHAICADRGLNDQDVRMSQLYDIVRRLVPMGTRGAIMDAQTRWLRDRNRCGGDRRCIGTAYSRRIGDFNRLLEQRVYSQGPF